MTYLRSNKKSSVKDIEDNNVKFLYHITIARHLQSILKLGILSHNEARNKGKVKEDISLLEVQHRRKNKMIDGKSLHDYACLYFDARNPMLYKVQKLFNDIIIIAIDKNILLEKTTLFSDGNAAANKTKLYSGTEYLSSLDWSHITADYWTEPHFQLEFHTEDKLMEDERKRIKCAEILVYPKVRPECIKAAICNSKDLYNLCSLYVNKKFPIDLDKRFFFDD